jgi:integrase
MAVIARGDTFGVRVYRGKGNGYEWVDTFPTRAEAKEAERVAKTTPGKPKARLTCDEFADQWLAQRHIKASSLAEYRNALARFKRDFHGVPLDRLDEDRAHEWAEGNRWRVGPVRAMFAEARRRGLVDRNPFDAVPARVSRGRRDLDPLTDAEVERLADIALDVHGGHFGRSMRALVLFGAYTGMRPGELYALDRDDLDLDRSVIQVARRLYAGASGSPKGNTGRTVALAPEAREALLSLPWTDGDVFRAKRGGPLSNSLMSGRDGYWASVRREFGRDVHLMELRHFCGHLLHVRRNLPARVVAVQLGHQSPRLVEDLYGHFKVGALDELKAAFGC